jgi:hypothetical protein
MTQGGNVGWVLNEFPKELQGCRRRQARSLLIVVTDADDVTVDTRRRQLLDRLKLEECQEFGQDEPAALLIPKRHVETWMRALLGESVTEQQDCKPHKAPTKEEVREAAHTLYAWSRPHATIGSTCVPSLEMALPQWRKIG